MSPVLSGFQVRCTTAFVVGVVVAAALASAGSAGSGATCQVAEQRTHDEAVFGHFSSRRLGLALATRASKLGFQGIKIEDEGCGDFEVEIDGADKGADRGSFAQEARKSGFEVTFEQTGPPMSPPSGQVVGIFGHTSTVAAANSLAGRLAAVNFRYIEVVRTGANWAVVMPQVPIASALSIAAEVHKAGFRVTFIKG